MDSFNASILFETPPTYLFQPFFTTEITGTGLGLYLSHSFCEANQAKLSYVAQKQGACFQIECPAVALN